MTHTYAPRDPSTGAYVPASERQRAFATRLVDERGGNVYDLLGHDGFLAERGFDLIADPSKFVSKHEASRVIDALMETPRRATEAQPEHRDATPGYYTAGDDFIVVVENKAGTHTYAKRLVVTTAGCRGHFDAEGALTYDDCGRTTARWEYAPGVGRTLAGLSPMSLEEAIEFGHLHGICFVCTKPLTDPASVARGIGPVCAKRFAAPA